MTTPDILKLAAGIALIAAGVWQYRRRTGSGAGAANDSYGSQSAVLLIVVGVIVLIVGLHGLEYRPSASELEAMQRQ